MKKLRPQHNLLVSACIAGLLLSSTPVRAQMFSDDVKKIVNSIEKVRASIEAAVFTTANYLFKYQPNISRTISLNVNSKTAQDTLLTNSKNTNDPVLQFIQNSLRPPANYDPISSMTLSVNAVDTVPTGVLGGISNFWTSGVQSMTEMQEKVGNNNMNFQAYWNPAVYGTGESTFANNYVQFVSGVATPPISTFSLKDTKLKTKDMATIQSDPIYKNFQLLRRTLTALESAGLSNLYYLYSLRLPQATLKLPNVKDDGTGLGVTTPTSPQQIKDYIATWRTNSATWHIRMQAATPASIQRETVFILAEIQAELHEIHQDNQRMLALQAISLLQNLQLSKQQLKGLESQVTDKVNKLLTGTPATTTTIPTAPPPTGGAPGGINIQTGPQSTGTAPGL